MTADALICVGMLVGQLRWRCGRDSVISEVVAEHESVVFTSWGWCICGVLCPCAGRVGSMLAAVGSCCVVFYMMEIWDVARSCAMPCCASDLRWLRKVVAVLLGWCQALWVSWLCNQPTTTWDGGARG